MNWNIELILAKNDFIPEKTDLKNKLKLIDSVELEEVNTNIQSHIKITANNIHKIKESVLTNIAYFLVKCFKQDFFKRELIKQPLPKVYIDALVKALTLFDMESDIFFTLNLLPKEGQLVPSSFYAFKMTKLKDKWQEFVNVTNLNSPYLANKEIFIEFLKFLYSIIEPQCDVVNVCYNKNSILLKDNENHNLSENIDVNDEISLITNLIFLAPNVINLHCIDIISNKTFKTLYYIFNKKINLMV